jgi:hypothetical protein
MRELCAKIVEEKDPERLSALVEQFIMLLSLEQDNIRAQIRSQAFGIGKPNVVGK